MKLLITLLFFSIGFGFVSCSDYNSIVKGDDYELKLKEANKLYDKGQSYQYKKNGELKIDRFGNPKIKDNSLFQSITLYEQIYQRMPKTGEGELSYFRIGKAYYLGKDFYMAGYYLGTFVQRFPVSVKCEEALFLSAMCSVNNSPDHTLDQQETELAINDLQQFINRYPASTLVDSCNHIMDRLRLKLERKDYESVKLYVKMEDYRAAVTSALTFMEDHPRSDKREEIYYQLVRNSYMLSKNSIESKKRERIEESIERSRNFVAEFPDSRYKKEVDNYFDLLNKELETLTSGN
ncbi:MAG: outer membrane protein assembly factor BamD [Bacteroidetes bacterium]|nr:MAG: outer membrane protein assembly factor BamD [Bacteroidota bacterium]